MLVALVAAVIAVVLLLRGGDEPYEVTGEFENASQLVPGNEVVVGGVAAGSVKTIELGEDGQALVTFTVEDEFAPLKRGTTATVRSYSLSGIANRQVQLTIPPDSEEGEEIPEGGTLDQSETVSEVDLDEVFNTLDKDTVADFKRVIKGFELSYDGVGEQANKGFKYANPFLSTSRGLFSELTYDQRAFERLIVDTANLSGALAQRAPDISALIGNLDLMMRAIGNQKLALAEAISKLPDFMRNANTTFVNLRAALDDIDPLVEAAKPAVRELDPFIDAACARRSPTRCRRSGTSTGSSFTPAPTTTSSISPATRSASPSARSGPGRPTAAPATSPTPRTAPATTTTPRAPSASPPALS